jgi:hypothetical protein
LPEVLSKLIRTDKVKVRETDGKICLIPRQVSNEYMSKLRGSLADYSQMSVDEFFARKHVDKVLE